MNKAGKAVFAHCMVIGSENLPPESGGSGALCRAIETAVAARSAIANYQVDLKVISASRLSAGVRVNGRPLPEQRFAVMDGQLNAGSIQRFADSVATMVAQAAK